MSDESHNACSSPVSWPLVNPDLTLLVQHWSDTLVRIEYLELQLVQCVDHLLFCFCSLLFVGTQSLKEQYTAGILIAIIINNHSVRFNPRKQA